MTAKVQREWTTSALTADLAAKLRADQFLVVAEVMLNGYTQQRADLLAMPRKLAHGPMLIVEIKTSRADLLGDMKREKWRGYLAHGAVAFAFPAGLADPKEIPAEAAVMVRIAQGWSWRRAPRWAAAPRASEYLYRRMCLSAWDQGRASLRAELEPRSASLWRQAQKARTEHGRRLARIANDIDLYEKLCADTKAEWLRLRHHIDRAKLPAWADGNV